MSRRVLSAVPDLPMPDPGAAAAAALVAQFASLSEAADVEYACAHVLSAVSSGADATAPAGELIAQIEQLGTPESLTILAGFVAVGDPELAATAEAALTRSRAAGVPESAVARDLTRPWVVRDPLALAGDGSRFLLAACFERAGRSDAAVLLLDEHCGAVEEVLFVPEPVLPEILEDARIALGRTGFVLRTEDIGAAEFRWAAEVALDARAYHDREDEAPADEQWWDEYAAQALLLRARLRGLPISTKPKPDHHEELSPEELLELIQDFRRIEALGRKKKPKLPAKRKKKDGAVEQSDHDHAGNGKRACPAGERSRARRYRGVAGPGCPTFRRRS